MTHEHMPPTQCLRSSNKCGLQRFGLYPQVKYTPNQPTVGVLTPNWALEC